MRGTRPPLTAEPLRLLPLFLLVPLFAACGGSEPAPLSHDEVAVRDSALTLLSNADTDTLGDAFERLDAFRYRIVTQTEQLGDGASVAQRTITAEVTPTADGPRADIVETDSSGAFDYGRFSVLASDGPVSPLATENPAPLVLPEDPAYLDPRGREAFTFGFAPDTVLSGQRVQIVTVDARAGADDQPLRSARLYLHSTTGAVVGVRLQRRTESLVFSESSDATILLQPGPAGGWLPRLTRVETEVNALFSDAHRFRIARRYADFQPAAAAGVVADGVVAGATAPISD
jgi:hypothetical protein